jgi:hypothetical protein
VPLERLFDSNTGLLRFENRKAVADYFGFASSAKLIISGVGPDRGIENYWSIRKFARLPEQLAKIKPDIVTGPNYSLFIDVPRWDNIYNMKRIAICWHELVSAGVPACLHVNARTDFDWERWTDFVSARKEIVSIAYEFATGAACIKRGEWHAAKLIELAKNVGRDLQLIQRGGFYFLKEISKAYSSVVFIDTTSFVRTTKRKKLEWTPGQKNRWCASPTEKGEPLDSLLLSNLETYSRMISHFISEN